MSGLEHAAAATYHLSSSLEWLQDGEREIRRERTGVRHRVAQSFLAESRKSLKSEGVKPHMSHAETGSRWAGLDGTKRSEAPVIAQSHCGTKTSSLNLLTAFLIRPTNQTESGALQRIGRQR